MASDQENVLATILEHLDTRPGYERHGDTVVDPWGAAQWIKYTDPHGEVRYLRVVVEPYRPT
jgi:hypothetical protein